MSSLAEAYAQAMAQEVSEVAFAREDARELQERFDFACGLTEAYDEAAAEGALDARLARQDARDLQDSVDAAETSSFARGLSAAFEAQAADDSFEAVLATEDAKSLREREDFSRALIEAYSQAACEDTFELSLAQEDARELMARMRAKDDEEVLSGGCTLRERSRSASPEDEDFEPPTKRPRSKEDAAEDDPVKFSWGRQLSDASTVAPDDLLVDVH